jgi:hypothetical protein
MSDIHNVFHVSQLKKCLRVPEEQISPDTVDLQDDLRYQEVPIKILDTVSKQTRSNTGKRRCPEKGVSHLFRNQANLKDEIHFKWGRFVTFQKFTFKNHSR